MSTVLDRRLAAFRPDKAAESLRGRVDAAEFVPGVLRSVRWPLASLRRRAEPDAPQDTEALFGEPVTVYEESAEGWAWVQLATDGYVGYLPSEALGSPHEPSHRVKALRTFVYPGPNLKLPMSAALTLGSRCLVSHVVDGYAATETGFIWAGHLAPLDAREIDFVAVAERFLGVPYLWGGKSSLGLDCSGLVQTALAAAGVAAQRDSDLQERDLGDALEEGAPLCRGDLIFWKGHVGILRNPTELLHANAHTMDVTSEPLAGARARIRAKTGADVTGLRRLPKPLFRTERSGDPEPGSPTG